ncbi:HIT family protein [Amycolatopsis alkalitolerans]|uniref:HIT family protein n=1 Tax=Amycolatopsis alkalitolerans TaxID=2547244 RepID=A0A5C4LUU3_9PSEU|nr:HIT family protein [Amycolatopsis alkalitolerans]TNC21542.1 HIT family protein [Amycolatopsis alkalitolerans]
MPTLFSRIINGELPGQIVWRDEVVAAFLSINPMGPGHTLVVPRAEVDHWIDADDELLAHMHRVGHRLGEAIHAVWSPPRVGVLIAGFEVPHLHLHVFPAWRMADLEISKAQQNPDPAELAKNAESLRRALREAGHGEFVPA